MTRKEDTVKQSDLGTKSTIEDPLKDYTYAVEHSPNCVYPYLVRLVGKGKATLDKLPPGRSMDAMGIGMTFVEAAEEALRVRFSS